MAVLMHCRLLMHCRQRTMLLYRSRRYEAISVLQKFVSLYKW